MPSGDVSLHELALAVKDRIEDQISYLNGDVEIIDPTDEDDINEFRKGLATRSHAVRILEGDLVPRPGMNNVIEWSLVMRLTVLFRKAGNMLARKGADDDIDLTKSVKDVINSLQGERLGLLNAGGLDCGPATLIYSEGSALQAMRFTVTGRSRESRS